MLVVAVVDRGLIVIPVLQELRAPLAIEFDIPFQDLQALQKDPQSRGPERITGIAVDVAA